MSLRIPSIARSDIHFTFDQKRWLLMPEDRILDTFCKSMGAIGKGNIEIAIRETFPKFTVCILSYRGLTF
jgi:hypothetical protein